VYIHKIEDQPAKESCCFDKNMLCKSTLDTRLNAQLRICGEEETLWTESRDDVWNHQSWVHSEGRKFLPILALIGAVALLWLNMHGGQNLSLCLQL